MTHGPEHPAAATGSVRARPWPTSGVVGVLRRARRRAGRAARGAGAARRPCTRPSTSTWSSSRARRRSTRAGRGWAGSRTSAGRRLRRPAGLPAWTTRPSARTASPSWPRGSASVARRAATADRGRARAPWWCWTGRPALRGLPDLAEVLEHGPSVGICVLALDDDRAALPSRGAVPCSTSATRPRRRCTCRARRTDLVVDRVGPWWADRLSRGLAPLRDATPGDRQPACRPPRSGLCELLWPGRRPGRWAQTSRAAGAHATPRTSSAVPDRSHDRRRHRSRSTSPPTAPTSWSPGRPAPASPSCCAPWWPRWPCTTAPNTSRWSSSTTRVAPPSVTARPCPTWPAVVTDLDDHLADRALDLPARLSSNVGSGCWLQPASTDFASYQSSPASHRPRSARLVIVIDEFRALAEELPQFVDGMVRVAALGRSLGRPPRPRDPTPGRGGHRGHQGQRQPPHRPAGPRPDRLRRRPRRARCRGPGPRRTRPRLRPGGGRPGHRLPGRARGWPVARHAEPGGIRVADARRGVAGSAPWPERSRPTTDASDGPVRRRRGRGLRLRRSAGARPAPSPWLPALADRLEAESLPAQPRTPSGSRSASPTSPRCSGSRRSSSTSPSPVTGASSGGAGSGRSTALLTVAGSASSARSAQTTSTCMP